MARPPIGLRTTLRDPDQSEIEVVVSNSSVTLSTEDSRVKMTERQARMLHTFLHRAFPSGNQVKRDLGMLSDRPTMHRESEKRTAFQGLFFQLVREMHRCVMLEKDKPLNDWDPLMRECVEWLVPIFYDLKDKGRVNFIEHPMPDSLLIAAGVPMQ